MIDEAVARPEVKRAEDAEETSRAEEERARRAEEERAALALTAVERARAADAGWRTWEAPQAEDVPLRGADE